jgi:putative Mn2+ efflux pump MntP
MITKDLSELSLLTKPDGTEVGFAELFLIAIGLSMDAFAVSICLGLNMQTVTAKKALTVGAYFGLFQAVMPLIGYYAATLFADKIEDYDHWVAFLLLSFLGVRMIIGSLKAEEEENEEAPLNAARMLPLAVATSIDASAVGISFAFLRVDIVPAIAVIGAVTFAVCVIGTRTGNIFGKRTGKWAEMAGGIILILIGLKILLEHLDILGL